MFLTLLGVMSEPLGSFTNFFFTIGHQDPLYRMWPMEAVFVLPKFTFDESKRCQFLFILSIGQDGVFQKILTSPISLMNIFWDTLYFRNSCSLIQLKDDTKNGKFCNHL